MSEGIRISQDMVKPYSGDGELTSWLKKVKLVAKLANIKDVASFIPLYLEGDALAVYLEMSDADQKEVEKIEERLKEAFTDSIFIAYEKLTKYKWDGEPVDVYCTEIRRLVGLSGLTGTGAEKLVKLAFINGMPENIRIELMQVEDVADVEMSDILTRARVLVGVRAESSVGAVASGSSFPSRGSKVRQVGKRIENKEVSDGTRSSGSGSAKFSSQGFKGKCYKCDGPHMARNCPDRKISCYNCGEEGHMSFNCKAEN